MHGWSDSRLKQGMIVHPKVVRNTLKTQHAKTHSLRPCSIPAECRKVYSRLEERARNAHFESGY